MTCRDIERLILERGDRRLDAAEHERIEEHLAACEKCGRYESGLAQIRAGLRNFDWGPVPERLALRTERMAGDVLRGDGGRRPSGRRGVAVPVPILAALAGLAVLTAVWITATLAGLEPGQALKDLPFGARAALFLIAQNGLVLFFAPIIIRALRPDRNGHHGVRP